MHLSNPILLKLAGGDRRSIGCADEVADQITSNPRLFKMVLKCLTGEDPVICMRAADAIEKATRIHPELLRKHTAEFLKLLASAQQQEVRWHLAQILPRLTLSPAQRITAIEMLEIYLQAPSRIVRTNAMQAMADLTQQDPSLRERVIPLIEHATATGTPAMRARGRKLLGNLSGV